MAFQLGASSSFSPSSSPSIRSGNHDVFLSFRGEDVRNNFISHLYKALVGRKISTYIDNNLERGEEISSALFEAIEGSMISIIVLSENYAESKWCLDELLKILDCKETIKQIVLPIFFKVDPSEVRHQKGIFGRSFDKLGDKLKNNAKMLKWKTALEKVANFSGFHFPSANCRDESECIQNIVEQVSSKLPNRTRLHVADHPVGLESRAEYIINTLLGIEIINETCMIGIFGIGGIGKTTTAKEVYNRIANKFEGSCFLANVRENSKKKKGCLVKLQKKILSKILRVNTKLVEVDDVDQGIILIQEKLCCKKILLILDDVDDLDQLKYLSGRSDWFGLGSRIIITTRDVHLLVQPGFGNWKTYSMNTLDSRDALKLFSWHAFKRDQPDNDFVELTKLAMQYAGGLPLALTVVGSNLRGRDRCFWKSELEKYERIQHKKIYDILKISFDGLDHYSKKIFLDIAFFFKGYKRDYVTKILDDCGFFADAGIKKLNDKCLITIDEYDQLEMHDLLEDMGKEIIRQESPEEPGKRSRLCFHDDVREVLERNKGTEQIEGILTKMPRKDSRISLDSDVFAKMEKLRILKVSTFYDCGGLNYLSNELRVLHWPKCPLLSLPSNFHGEKLFHFYIRGSNIRDLGTRLQSKNLTSIDLSCCEYLTNISDLSSCSNLEELFFTGCKSLVEVHDSVGFLDKLVHLDFNKCYSLKKLPRSFKLRCLESLKFEGCTSLEYFPEIECEIEHLKCVEISSTIIQELPSSITYLTRLKMLYIYECNSLVHFPVNIFQLEHLEKVFIINCPNFVNFGKEVGYNGQFVPCTQENEISSSTELPPLPPPESNNLFRAFNFSSSLRILNLYGSGIVSLPPWIEGFVGLSELDLSDCKQLEKILHLPPNIEEVDASRCSSLKNFLTESNNLSWTYNISSSLRTLNLFRSGIVSLPPCIEGFVGLSKLDLRDCKQLEEILHLPPNIEEVEASGCVLLERFPHVSTESSFGTPDLKRLTRIDLSECNQVEVDVGNHAPGPLLVQKRFREKDSSMIIYPGNKIPEWFKYCKETTYSDSIEIEIDHNASMCCGHQIVALVLCFVAGPLPARDFYSFTVSRNGQRIGNDKIWSWDSMDPHRVCLKYVAGNSIDEILPRSYRGGNNNMRFAFESDRKKAIFKSAGVHLIYGNDNFIDPIQLSKRYRRDDGEHDLEPDWNPQQKRKSSTTRVMEFKDLDLDLERRLGN
ncbi:hypothetical protein I3760_15G139900 [Carya illinoinensis]|nr:hypothetical protein I3760_15G139900 [Carya illinoinensis]